MRAAISLAAVAASSFAATSTAQEAASLDMATPVCLDGNCDEDRVRGIVAAARRQPGQLGRLALHAARRVVERHRDPRNTLGEPHKHLVEVNLRQHRPPAAVGQGSKLTLLFINQSIKQSR